MLLFYYDYLLTLCCQQYVCDITYSVNKRWMLIYPFLIVYLLYEIFMLILSLIVYIRIKDPQQLSWFIYLYTTFTKFHFPSCSWVNLLGTVWTYLARIFSIFLAPPPLSPITSKLQIKYALDVWYWITTLACDTVHFKFL